MNGDDLRDQLAEAMAAQHGCDTLLSTSGRPCNRCRQSAKTLLPVVEHIATARVVEARATAWDEGYAAAEADEDRHPWDATRNPHRTIAAALDPQPTHQEGHHQ